jgi:hypothetical protein
VSGDRKAILDALAWWDGDRAHALGILKATGALKLAEVELASARDDPRADTPRIQGLIKSSKRGLESCRATLLQLVESALVSGLRQRQSCYLRPAGFPTADGAVYEILCNLRVQAGGPARVAQPLPRVELPPALPSDPHPLTHAYIVVCERCTSVSFRERYANRCHRCHGMHDRLAEVLWKPVTIPGAGIVVGETAVTTGVCDVCGEAFARERSSAKAPHPACRTAQSRRLARETWTDAEDEEKVLAALTANPEPVEALKREAGVPRLYVVGALRRLEIQGRAISHPIGLAKLVNPGAIP